MPVDNAEKDTCVDKSIHEAVVDVTESKQN